MSVRIKICGITNQTDALAAVDAGAEALGFIFYAHSPRSVTTLFVAALARELPLSVAKVGVFVDPTEESVNMAVQACGLDIVQFHGDETPGFCRKFTSVKVWKAFRLKGPESLQRLPGYETSAWLLDAFVPGKAGGTGKVLDWSLAIAAKELGRPIILAGGLTPENVGNAVRRVQPFGVDVSSGVESSPGRKDHGKMREFVAAIKAATVAEIP